MVGKTRLNGRTLTVTSVLLAIGLVGLVLPAQRASADAVMGTYAQPSIMVADGTTVYTAWVFADNNGLNGALTWGTQHQFFLPPYATLIPGGLGIAYGKPDPSRDFFEGNPMVFEVLSAPNIVSGRLVNQADQIANKLGDLQFYRFTVNPGAPTGPGNFDLGPSSVMTGPDAAAQPYTKQNIPFTITSLAGDFNLDGFVGIEDLNLVLGNFNASTNTFNPPPGDATGDGFVGIEDLNWVLGNWNAGTPPPPPAAVPEPATATLLAAACLSLLRRSLPLSLD